MQALKGAGIMPGKDVMVVGIDGQKEAVQAIIDGEMACTVTCSPDDGPIVFDRIEKLVKGEQVPVSIVMPGYVIDSTNAKQELDKAF